MPLSGIGRYHYSEPDKQRFDHVPEYGGAEDSTVETCLAGDTAGLCRVALPPFPTIRYVETLLRPDATVDDYGDLCVLSFDDSLSRRQCTIDKTRWLIVGTRRCVLAKDDTGWVSSDGLYFRYESIGGIYAVVSITPFDPDDSLQTELPFMMGGYYFSNIILNEPIDESVFARDVAGIRYALRSPSVRLPTGPRDGRAFVVDLAGRTVSQAVHPYGSVQGFRIAVDPLEPSRTPVISVDGYAAGQ